MAETGDRQPFHNKRKAITSLFLYALLQERVGEQEIFGALSRAAMALGSGRFIWRRVKSYIPTLSNKPSSPSLNQVIILGLPHVPWHDGSCDKNMVIRWAAAASAVPYTGEVDQSVVDALLYIVSVDSLRPHIPIGIWAWLKKRPTLPPECSGRLKGTRGRHSPSPSTWRH